MFMQEVELFKSIPSHILHEITQFASEESVQAEEVLFREGDIAEYLYILEDGQVVITVPGKKAITFPVDSAGSVFGWSALVEPRRYTASAECTMDSKVIKIDGERLLKLFERYPHEGLLILRRLAGVMGTRLVQSYRRV
ncbi:MAG: cyclic nucleotide-binding domain-containing protein [Deltaproteobacteria bacterium]|nr:cyclic nucleotide-binding domain-containing protein [Deltaproteobacteria bacterium]